MRLNLGLDPFAAHAHECIDVPPECVWVRIAEMRGDVLQEVFGEVR